MNNFIDIIQQISNVSVYITKNDLEILSLNGTIKKMIIDEKLITLDFDYCGVTIDRSWGIMSVKNNNHFIFNCGDNVYLYIDTFND